MESVEKKRLPFWRIISSLLGFGRVLKKAETQNKHVARYRMIYEKFREILNINDSMLRLIADINDNILEQLPFVLDPVIQRIRKAMLDVFLMVNAF